MLIEANTNVENVLRKQHADYLHCSSNALIVAMQIARFLARFVKKRLLNKPERALTVCRTVADMGNFVTSLLQTENISAMI